MRERSAWESEAAWERLYAVVGNWLDEYKGEILAWMETELGPATWKCKANRTADPPQDCDWPICGCDPYADKVIEALQESGKLKP